VVTNLCDIRLSFQLIIFFALLISGLVSIIFSMFIMHLKTLNLFSGVGTDANAVDQSKRLRTGGDYTHSPYVPPAFHPPPPAVSMWGTAG
jgi:hypothetical protein